MPVWRHGMTLTRMVLCRCMADGKVEIMIHAACAVGAVWKGEWGDDVCSSTLVMGQPVASKPGRDAVGYHVGRGEACFAGRTGAGAGTGVGYLIELSSGVVEMSICRLGGD